MVLPDSDASVARVHAMVRMESEAAFIANLCERRSITVAGQEVRSGEEVPLAIGDEVVIGPYRLYALLPGQALPAPVAPAVKADVAPVAPLEAAPAAAPQALASDLLEELQAPADAGNSNPFAILGLVSDPIEASSDAEPPTVPAFMAMPHEEVAAAGVPPDVPAEPLVSDSSRDTRLQVPVLPADLSPTAGVATAPLPSGWDDTPMPRSAPAAAHRALVIPDDFDLFAQDPKKQAQKGDPWAGGLQTKSLTDVANLRHDELLKALPVSGRFEHQMDNPAHAGLPKALDPRNELDPLRLFQQDRESPALQDTSLAVPGCDLSQAFSMPKSTAAGSGTDERLPVGALGIEAISVDAAVSSTKAKVVPPDLAIPLRNEPVIAPLPGLRKVEGLNLDSFGSGLPAADSDWLPPIEPVSPVLEKSAVPPAFLEDRTVQHRDEIMSFAAPLEPLPPSNLPAPAPAPAPALSPSPSSDFPAPATLPGLAAMPPAELSALVTAFLDGAGVLPKKLEPTLTPEFMRSFGEAFRVAVQGTIDLLAARSEIKREFRAGVTVIASGANNPLKFLPTPDGVIMQMIGQNFPGFMQPVPAMKDAYQDLCVHQLALMAGIRAAYAEALARFDPVELEKQAASIGGMLGKVSSIGRKAALWDEYKKNFDAIRRDAEDDLTAFSGQAFLEAYENAEAAAKAKL